MTINKASGHISITCDQCGASFPEDLPEASFADAQKAMRARGWKPQRKAGAWEHACNHCAKFQDGRLL